MPGPLKKRALNKKDNSKDDDSDSSYEFTEEEYTGNEVIQVDFEGRNPTDYDFDGIKQLLNQLFLKAHINLSELTDLIISQNYVGSVVLQADDDEDDDDEDDQLTERNSVFGITTMINISEKQNMECIKQLRALLLQLANDHATDQINTFVRQILQNDAQPVGLLINERFVNIPAEIAVPLIENLIKEMRRAAKKKMPFTFEHIIMICKIFKTDKRQKQSKKKSKKKSEEPTIIWSNPEEEVTSELADFSFEFPIKDDSARGVAGQWTEHDAPMRPYRRILIIPANKLDEMLEKIKGCV